MNVLIACEFSGIVRDAFIAKGHNAFSCDILRCEGDDTFHFEEDMFIVFDLVKWDLIIAHPPCTFLTVAAEWAFDDEPKIKGVPRKIKPGTLIGEARREARKKAADFVQKIWGLPVDKLCIENPVGVINRFNPEMPKPQYVQPYDFGEDASKKTGLWLRGLPALKQKNYIEPRIINGKKRWSNQTDAGQNNLPPSLERDKLRSITYQGIADAMAEQWG